jgi:uncharacterized cupin superfamily protein
MQRYELNWTPFEPVAQERIRAGQPSTRLAESVKNDRFTSGLWEVTEGRFTTAPKGYDETIHILSGRGVLRSIDGSSIDLRPGVMLLMEDGFEGEWEIHEPLRKFYVQVQTSRIS